MYEGLKSSIYFTFRKFSVRISLSLSQPESRVEWGGTGKVYQVLKSVILVLVHNANYASGFLYHPSTEKILLQLTPENRNSSLWSLFSDRQPVENQSGSFQKIIFEQLRILIQPTAIVPIYDYLRAAKGEVHFIYYAEVDKEDMGLQPKRGCTVRWFTQKEITKLSLLPQERHDIMIGTRVIRSIVDKREAVQSITSLDKG